MPVEDLSAAGYRPRKPYMLAPSLPGPCRTSNTAYNKDLTYGIRAVGDAPPRPMDFAAVCGPYGYASPYADRA